VTAGGWKESSQSAGYSSLNGAKCKDGCLLTRRWLAYARPGRGIAGFKGALRRHAYERNYQFCNVLFQQ